MVRVVDFASVLFVHRLLCGSISISEHLPKCAHNLINHAVTLPYYDVLLTDLATLCHTVPPLLSNKIKEEILSSVQKLTAQVTCTSKGAILPRKTISTAAALYRS